MADVLGEALDPLDAGLDCPTVNTHSAALDDETPLVLAAKAGDRVAFGHLYDRYARVVHGVLLARVPLGEVDDLVHEVFLRALPRLHTLRQPERFGSWLIAIARNCANDYHRRRPAQAEVNADLVDATEPASDGGQASDSKAAAILDAIRSLPHAYRETLLLRLVEGMTGPEIALRTGLTPGSVRVNLHRGMQQLRAKLKDAKLLGNVSGSSTPSEPKVDSRRVDS
jgi:RNA polymerase sigma-70 factor, ECF subfamily